jgi:hypothetical protein
MGRSFFLSTDLAFGIRTSFALFHSSGNRAAAKSPFIRLKRVRGTTSANSRITSGGMPSGPGAFPGLSFSAAVRSSSVVKGSTAPISTLGHSAIGLMGKSFATASLRSSRLSGVFFWNFPVAIRYPLPHWSFSTLSCNFSHALAFAARIYFFSRFLAWADTLSILPIVSSCCRCVALLRALARRLLLLR